MCAVMGDLLKDLPISFSRWKLPMKIYVRRDPQLTNIWLVLLLLLPLVPAPAAAMAQTPAITLALAPVLHWYQDMNNTWYGYDQVPGISDDWVWGGGGCTR